jgi:peptide/nickel transport system permease protein
VRQYGWTDKIVTFFVLIGISTPSFFLGMLLILWFSVGLRWFPASGMYSPSMAAATCPTCSAT